MTKERTFLISGVIGELVRVHFIVSCKSSISRQNLLYHITLDSVEVVFARVRDGYLCRLILYTSTNDRDVYVIVFEFQPFLLLS